MRRRVAPIIAGVGANPVARTLAALVLFLASLGGLTLTSYADQLANGGVTWGPLPADYKPIPLANVNPMGANLFLEKEVDPANITRTLEMVRDGGFRWARQGFAWNDIEISAKGDYTDSRNPGAPIDAWAKYDRIVAAYERYGIEIIARLDSPPVWARMPGDDTEQFRKGPPRDNNDYGDFVYAVANRYRGKIKYFQIWNEPNLYGEWGGHPVNAEEYTALLKVAYTRAREANPDAVIITAALAPTAEDSVANQNDILFLEAMYRAGAAPYFDVLSTMLYGLGYSPHERRTDLKRLNFSRPILLRQVMERNGDTQTPIWISEYAWLSLPPDWKGDPTKNIWGESVDEATQARWLVEGYERVQREWPWMGVMSVWYFREPEPRPEEPANHFAIVNPDYTPRPAYNALKEFSARRAYGNAPAVKVLDRDDNVSHNGALNGFFGTFKETLSFNGTGLDVRLCRFCSVSVLSVDGRVVSAPQIRNGPTRAEQAGQAITLLSGLPDSEHTVTTQGEYSQLAGEEANISYMAVRKEEPPRKPVWNAWGFPALYGLFGLFAVASATFGLASLGRWASAALNRPGDRYSSEAREIARNGAAVTGMALMVAFYYRTGSVALMLACLAAFTGIAFFKPQAGLAAVAFAIPFFWLPKELGSRQFPIAETLLVLTFVAVLARRVMSMVSGLGRWRQDGGGKSDSDPLLTRPLSQTTSLSSFVMRHASPQSSILTPQSYQSALRDWRTWNHQDPMAPPAVALLLVGTLSLFLLADPAFASDSFRAYRWVIVEPILFYFLLTEVIGSRRGLLRVADFFVAAAVVVALIGLWQYAQGTNLLVVEGVKRIQSIYEHPNNLALYLGRVAPFAACMAVLLPWGWRKALYGTAALPLAAALLLTFSRGAWLAVPLATLLALGLAWWLKRLGSGDRPSFRLRPIWAASGVATLAVLVVAAVVIVPRLPPRVWDLGSGLLRLDIWNSSLKMLGDHPLQGVGIDQFLNQFQSKYLPPGSEESFTSHPHNLILDSWLSLGIMGLAVFAWLLWRYFGVSIAGIESALRRNDPVGRAVSVGLMASMAAFAIHGLVDSSYFLADLAMIFWLSCGMVQVIRNT